MDAKLKEQKAKFRKVLRELKNKPRVPRAIKAKHGDIEDAIVAAGGERGGINHAEA
jgi:hypothetical protein